MSVKQKTFSQGFTLLEMLIAIAIIGILAAVAIPGYKQFTIRAKMVDALVLMEANKERIEEFYDLNNRLPLDESDVFSNMPTPVDDIVEKLALQGDYTGDTATIYVMLGNGIADISSSDGAFGLRATKHPQGHLTWSCINFGLNPDYLPAQCN